MFRRVVSWKLTDVSVVLTAPLPGQAVIHHSDDGVSKHLRTVGQFLRYYTAQHHGSHLHARRRENLKSHKTVLKL